MNLLPSPYSRKYSKTGAVREYSMCVSCNTQRLLKYRSTKVGKSTTQKAVNASIKRYPEKTKARSEVSKALSRKEISKPTYCETCNNSRQLDAHHEDYSKPLDVRWLCRQCHAAFHLSRRNST